MVMKKILLAVSTISVCAFLVISVYAHSGRTDGNGGHTDNSTGEYHYHHGHPAHDHYDMDGDGDLDCPYDFKDKTDHSSNKKGNSNTSKNQKKKSPDIGTKVCLSLMVLFPVAFLISMPIMCIAMDIIYRFKVEPSDRAINIFMCAVYFLISGCLIYLIIIW